MGCSQFVHYDDLINELNLEAGRFRHEISRLLTSKTVPSISFNYDVSIERAQRLSEIIDSVNDK